MSGRIALCLAVLVACIGLVRADPDLPGPTANVRTVLAGSYIIPADNDKQSLVTAGRFNFKSYGLIIKLLHASVPVYWIIRTGKGVRSMTNVGVYSQNTIPTGSDGGVDFTASAKQVYPTVGTASSLGFWGGPWIIEKFQVVKAIPVLDASKTAGDKVAVYELMADTSMDIRHTLTQKPFIGVLNSGGYYTIPEKYCVLARLTEGTHYSIMSISDARGIGGNVCVTIATEPHYESTDPTFKDNMYLYLNSGGNFLAHCAAIGTYELSGGTVSNAGIKYFGSTTATARSQDLIYDYPDLPYSQTDGPFPGSNTGLIENFRLRTNGYDTASLPSGVTQSRFINNGHSVIRNRVPSAAPIIPAPAGIDKNAPDTYYATHAKMTRDAVGGNMYFLGTHDFAVSGSTIYHDNGLRMYLNAVLTPATRPASCGFTIEGCPSVLCTNTWEKPDDTNSCICTCQPDLFKVAAPCAAGFIMDSANCACLNPSDSTIVLPSNSPVSKGKKAPEEVANPPPIKVNDNKSKDALIGGVVGAVVGAAACLGLAAFLLARKNKKDKEEYEKACTEGELALSGTAENPLFAEFGKHSQNPIFDQDHCVNL